MLKISITRRIAYVLSIIGVLLFSTQISGVDIDVKNCKYRGRKQEECHADASRYGFPK